MMARRAVTAFVLVLLACAVSAQEFGHATAGEIVVTPKGSAPLSGSFQLSRSTVGSNLYDLSAGGALVHDRLWFFGSASRQQSTFADLAIPQNAFATKANAQFTGAQDLSAFFETAKHPASFLTMHYNAVVSSNAYFSASFTRSQ